LIEIRDAKLRFFFKVLSLNATVKQHNRGIAKVHRKKVINSLRARAVVLNTTISFTCPVLCALVVSKSVEKKVPMLYVKFV